jgi:hypothetical protein
VCGDGEVEVFKWRVYREVEERGVMHDGLNALWYSIAFPMFLDRGI